MTTLVNAQRVAITRKVIAAASTPRYEALRKQEYSLALRLTQARYGKDVFDRCRSLPEGWLSAHRTITFDANWARGEFVGSYDTIQRVDGPYISSPGWGLDLESSAILPNSFQRLWGSKEVSAKLVDELATFFRVHVALHEEIEQLRAQITATLKSFATVEKLAEGWPEGYAHLPQQTLAETGGLPALRIADLNARIAAMKEAA